jgi:hypothetical protein
MNEISGECSTHIFINIPVETFLVTYFISVSVSVNYFVPLGVRLVGRNSECSNLKQGISIYLHWYVYIYIYRIYVLN